MKEQEMEPNRFYEEMALSPVGQERTVRLGSLAAARCLVFGLGPSVRLDPVTWSFDSPIQCFFSEKVTLF